MFRLLLCGAIGNVGLVNEEGAPKARDRNTASGASWQEHLVVRTRMAEKWILDAGSKSNGDGQNEGDRKSVV